MIKNILKVKIDRPSAKVIRIKVGSTQISERKPVRKVTDNNQVWSEIDFYHKFRRIIMAAKTKPFVILAGISGSGKSRLTRTLAYKCCTEQLKNKHGFPGNYLLMQVKSDWHDSSEFIGYVVSKRGLYTYIFTPFIVFLAKAWRYPDIPFILCLDEMNLANVEHYFSDFLSIIESRKFVNGIMISDPFISNADVQTYVKGDRTFWQRLGIEVYSDLQRHFLTNGITLPPNLIVIGTINGDETTSHPISKRVLDRAMIILMNGVDLDLALTSPSQDLEYPNEYMPFQYLIGNMNEGHHPYEMDVNLGAEVINRLRPLQDVLLGTSAQFSYRVRNEILIYCYFNSLLLGKPKNWLDVCFDEIILMKILPKLIVNRDVDSAMLEELIAATYRYPLSQWRILDIKERLGEWKYASFIGS